MVIHGDDLSEVLAILASKVASADSSEVADVVTMDRVRIDKLKAVFGDIMAISLEVETIHLGDSDPR